MCEREIERNGPVEKNANFAFLPDAGHPGITTGVEWHSSQVEERVIRANQPLKRINPGSTYERQILFGIAAPVEVNINIIHEVTNVVTANIWPFFVACRLHYAKNRMKDTEIWLKDKSRA